MIKQIKFQNWKSFADSTLYIDPITILMGTNAAGKSNAIEALLFLQDLANGESLAQIQASKTGDYLYRGNLDDLVKRGCTQFSLELLLEIDDEEFVYTIQFIKNTKWSSEPKWSIESEHLYSMVDEERQVMVSVTPHDGTTFLLKINSFKEVGLHFKPYNRMYFTQFWMSLLDDLPEYPQHRAYFDKANKFIEHLLLSLRNILFLSPEPKNMRDYATVSSNLQSDASNISGVLATLSEQEGLSEQINSNLTTLSEEGIFDIQAPRTGIHRQDAKLQYREGSHENNLFDATSMSDGSLRFLAIIVAIFSLPKGALLLIEEIGTGLHPSRIKLLFDTLRNLGEERGIDILVTTHNPALLHIVSQEILPAVYIVHREKSQGNSQITAIEDIDGATKIISWGLDYSSREGKIEAFLRGTK